MVKPGEPLESDSGESGPRSDFLPFSPPFVPKDGIDAVREVLSSGWLGTGPLTQQFEREFAEYIGAPNSVAVSSCTSGLFLTMKALGLGPGDEVITTAMTFCSTVNSILHCGAKPVLCDIDGATGNLDVSQLERKVSKRTKAILVVHYAGMPCDMTQIMEFADQKGFYVIEDCAHSIEGLHREVSTGNFGVAGVYSFYATKNIAVGEGGMVVTGDPELAHRVATLSLHGLSRGAWRRFSQPGRRTYDVEDIGYKANFTDIQAAIAIAQLRIVEDNLSRRSRIWDFFLDELEGLPLRLPSRPKSSADRHALHLFVVLLEEGHDRDTIVEQVAEEHSVALGIHYRAIPDFAIYQRLLRVRPTDFPVATDWGRRCISLSLSPGMSDSHIERVVESMKAMF